MDRGPAFNNAVSLFVTTGFVVLGYETKELPKQMGIDTDLVAVRLGMSLIGLIAGITISPYIAELLSRSKLIRRIVLRDIWIEGYWIVKTFRVKNGQTEYITSSVCHFFYRGAELQLCNRIYHKQGILSSGDRWSHSENINIEESTRFYLNNFLSDESTGEQTGIAYGVFSSDGDRSSPNVYNGSLVFVHDSDSRETFRQTAFKMTNREVQELKKLHPEETVWKGEAIKKYEASPVKVKP